MAVSTYFSKKGEEQRGWIIIDLTDKILGRAATKIANHLRGKNKTRFTPHVDTGDFVIVINADKVKLTGNKELEKKYYTHSGYRGGLKTKNVSELRARKPEEIIRHAVKGMLPKNKMTKHLMRKLKIYSGSEHPHQAQQPQSIEIQ
ncbi:MAG: 50S ribosomal protein L13 [Deltaproteobacteria bacterium RIFCSPLOWO2_02_FULL_50_16]|nr:MAG: 50S ribosomal protein L13 [Deltaproteobacteria bacterium GWA2_50_8]OGQ31537.1 MAG: 50S ribosomal protein L13 [Deltaproteobacteria bacterium RIFCSPHIGHO2_02_FULL_50_15]OGQ56801.1 MAG: 50S ribosomal protein L13 [Deltaproteobacteria bacterium RIFCSPLOWO2_02_FULL_50_16]OGQ67324.1 MAG: 50S ribosomal protein L13 [Deltaproteobacteria bacterium RIFCSPLOWO2_12_FULL_50_11]